MGLLRKGINARTAQILRNTFDSDVEFDFVAGGVFYCDKLQFSIRPFVAAVSDDGIIFIHKGKVALALEWSLILSRKPDIWGKGSELLIATNKTSPLARPREFPFCFWHKAEITFNRPEDHEKFLQKYYAKKIESGFSEESLALHNTWLTYEIGLPVGQDEYMKANEGWGTKESRIDSFIHWGRVQDATRFLYYVGRKVCQGILPGSLIRQAVNEYLECEKRHSEYTNNIVTFNDDFLKLIEETEALSIFPGNADDLAIGRIEVDESEWKSEIPTPFRLAAFDFQETPSNVLEIRVWSDFHDGSALIVNGVINSFGENNLNLSTSMGVVLIPGGAHLANKDWSVIPT